MHACTLTCVELDLVDVRVAAACIAASCRGWPHPACAGRLDIYLQYIYVHAKHWASRREKAE